MIFRYLSKADLQNIVGNDLLSRLEGLLPILAPDQSDPTVLYSKEYLIKILSAFSSSRKMKDKSFVNKLLNALPIEQLKDLSKATGVGTAGLGFEEILSSLVNKGWRDIDFCKAFVNAVGLPESFLPEPQSKFKVKESLSKAYLPYKRLKDFQYDVYKDAESILDINLARFIIQMPTGSGKTRTAMEFICEALNRTHENGVVIWLAHSGELCEQAIECFKEVWVHIGERPLSIIRCWGQTPKLPSEEDGTLLIVAGFQKLYSLLKNKGLEDFEKIKARTDLLVIDEAHKVLAPTYEEVTRKMIGNNTKVVGLTATPGRNIADTDQNEKLAKFFFTKIIGINTPKGHTVISYLRSRKILSKVVMEQLVTSNSYELTPQQKSYLEMYLDYPPGFLKSLGEDDLRNVEIMKRLSLKCEEGANILFFGCSVDQSKFICALLTFLGYKSAHVDGSTPRSERQHLLESFKSGRIQVLTNYGVLTTGFDAPKVDTVFIARPTQSIVLYSQMIGRGLRGEALGGTSKCTIINVKDNIVGLPKENIIYDYFEDYWIE